MDYVYYCRETSGNRGNINIDRIGAAELLRRPEFPIFVRNMFGFQELARAKVNTAEVWGCE